MNAAPCWVSVFVWVYGAGVLGEWLSLIMRAVGLCSVQAEFVITCVEQIRGWKELLNVSAIGCVKPRERLATTVVVMWKPLWDSPSIDSVHVAGWWLPSWRWGWPSKMWAQNVVSYAASVLNIYTNRCQVELFAAECIFVEVVVVPIHS